jgi:hypothetical protein
MSIVSSPLARVSWPCNAARVTSDRGPREIAHLEHRPGRACRVIRDFLGWPDRLRLLWLTAALAAGLGGCASERLAAVAPGGVNLTGEWKLNVNLSDDPDKQVTPDKEPQRDPLGRRGRRGGATGLPQIGAPDGPSNFASPASPGASLAPGTAYAFDSPGIEQSNPLPPVDNAPNSSGSGKSKLARLLQAPDHLSIVHKGAVVTIKSVMSDGRTFSDEYTAGTQGTVPYGADNTAERSAGWRGPVFVVTTSVKKGGTREDDYALDDDGRLIMTTQTHGGRVGKNDLVRVYDRIRG